MVHGKRITLEMNGFTIARKKKERKEKFIAKKQEQP